MTQQATLYVTVNADRHLLLQQVPGGGVLPGWSEQIIKRYNAGGDAWLVSLAFEVERPEADDSLRFLHRLLKAAPEQLRRLDRELAESARPRLPLREADIDFAALLHACPMMTGGEYVDDDLLRGIWRRLCEELARQLQDWRGSVEAFLQSLRPDLQLPGRVYFHLAENKMGGQPFAFLATYTSRLDDAATARHLPLRYALTEFADDREQLLGLLRTVQRAAGESELVAGLLASGELFHPLEFNLDEAWTVLRELPAYEACGIVCRVPAWWQRRPAKAALKVEIGGRDPSWFGADTLLAAVPTLSINGTAISPEEAQALLSLEGPLVQFRGQWAAIDRAALERLLAAFDSARDELAAGMSLRDALRLQNDLAIDQLPDEGVEVTHGEWLADMLGKLRDPQRLETVKPPASFKAALRPYQQSGLNWLSFMTRIGLGACLADDMGLGKTIQILALLAGRYSGPHRPARPTLLVVPASLLGNWQAETAKFAPRLKLFIYHGGAMDTPLGEVDAESVAAQHVVMTTYGLVQRYDWLAAAPWYMVILDEAQAIKNPDAKQTRAIKQLQAPHRIVLTGTPVENRLEDLWSIFDFINPGMLGTRTEFRRLFAGEVGRDTRYARLRTVLSPAILRRLKTDPAIVPDLPEKVEVIAHASLSKRQRVLYRALIDDLASQLDHLSGMQRRGLVLATLMKLKQLCNHPDHYLGMDSYAPKDSGKFLRLAEICETIRAKGERVLVFTQFEAITQPLSRFLEQQFGQPGDIISGKVAPAKRTKIVERFQGGDDLAFLVLTVKAAGIGLNLTRANHVIHFDRWWNPAAENQATDRAFRIGQKRDVLVHKMLTDETVEERIDALLTDKRGLAASIIPDSGEAWLTELSNEQLLNLVSLG